MEFPSTGGRHLGHTCSPKELVHNLPELAEVRLGCRGAGNEDHIPPFLYRRLADQLSKSPLHTVPHYRISYPPAYGESDPAGPHSVGTHPQDYQLVGPASSLTQDSLNLGRLSKTTVPAQGVIHGLVGTTLFGDQQTRPPTGNGP